jgi:hypothetical protein
MKRSQVYSLIFIFFIIVILMNIVVLSSHHVVTEEKCFELEIQNDSLQHTLDTIIIK